MTAIYDAYKPMRNYFRQCALEETWADMWQLSRHISYPKAIQAPVHAGEWPYSLDGEVFQWELPTIAREVLLHAQERGGDKRLNSLAAVQTVIRSLRNTSYEGSSFDSLATMTSSMTAAPCASAVSLAAREHL